MILWRGHCSVHGRFSLQNVVDARSARPDVRVLVHPECQHEVVEAADEVGSTEYIINAVEAAPAGTAWVIGTELNLVRRLALQHPEQTIMFLEKNVCFCSTMNRIDLPHLVWALESLAAGRVVNRIVVDPDVAHWARVALDQMLALPGATAQGLSATAVPAGSAPYRTCRARCGGGGVRRCRPDATAAGPRPGTRERTRPGAGTRRSRAPGCAGPPRR